MVIYMLTKRQLDLWYAYVYNTRCFLEDEIKQLRETLRYKPVDVVDCLELSLALERLAAFNKFASETNNIFKLKTADDLEIKSPDK